GVLARSGEGEGPGLGERRAQRGRALPVVVAEDERAARIVDVEARIIEHAGDAKGPERRADAADQHGLRHGAIDVETSDEDAGAGADLRARGDVDETRRGREPGIVNFGESDSGRAAVAGDLRGVRAGDERADERGVL